MKEGGGMEGGGRAVPAVDHLEQRRARLAHARDEDGEVGHVGELVRVREEGLVGLTRRERHHVRRRCAREGPRARGEEQEQRGNVSPTRAWPSALGLG
jgi:hypothetical protein